MGLKLYGLHIAAVPLRETFVQTLHVFSTVCLRFHVITFNFFPRFAMLVVLSEFVHSDVC